jgi:hypothetical protein
VSGWRGERLDELDALVGLPAEARTKTAREREGGSNSVVESQPSKLLVAGSIPVSRSRLRQTFASLTASSGQAEDQFGLNGAESLFR